MTNVAYHASASSLCMVMAMQSVIIGPVEVHIQRADEQHACIDTHPSLLQAEVPSFKAV